MASIPAQLIFASKVSNNSSSSSSSSCGSLPLHLGSQFVGLGKRRSLGWLRPSRIGPNSGGSNGSRATCWFKFGTNGVDAEGAGIYGSQSRNDFDRDDVEQYFNYMGMLAVEGTYDKMEALLNQNIHPVDILLLLASSEGDRPKIEELLKAGAKCDVKDGNGLTAVDRAASEDIKDLILGFSTQKA